MKLVTLALAFVVTAFPLASIAQDTSGTAADEQILLKQIQTNKRGVYADNLKLTEAESKAFWPVYDQYEAELKKVDDRFLAAINDYVAKYDTLTDAEASRMLKERMTLERKRFDVKARYTDRIAKVLPGKKALRFAQLESRIDNLARRNLYTIIPLAR
jgi:Spy/CpxP family protein refolding chaperone